MGNYASAGDDHIIPIAYHVDYWNRLGWTDTFSKRKFTQRQEEYASKFELGSIYTPQLIINGQKELVGSDQSRIAALVNGFLKEASILTIKISSTVMAESKLVINYSVNKILTGSSINAVLILDSITTVIRAGENRGLELVNHNVVQDFSSSHLSGTIGNITLKIPYGKLKTGSSIVLFVQDEVNGKISGAVKVKL